jgi:hypothetical protein
MGGTGRTAMAEIVIKQSVNPVLGVAAALAHPPANKLEGGGLKS